MIVHTAQPVMMVTLLGTTVIVLKSWHHSPVLAQIAVDGGNTVQRLIVALKNGGEHTVV